ncbi:MAG TPA: DPP IV N-terminal domain-containing protein, partial [Gemmatimonadaceae bacterium]|nr:DPP IV N-terminal domain-containing protein [Gemmatimonadaceae bacterium]
MHRRLVHRLPCPLLTALLASGLHAVNAAAQQPRPFTTADYTRAERAATAPAAITAIANEGRVIAHWLPDDRFWYRDSASTGVLFYLVDPVKKTKLPAFDQGKVAAALAAATGSTVDAAHLPFAEIAYSKDRKAIMVTVAGKEWSCGVTGGKCSALAAGAIAAATVGEPTGARGGGRGGRGGGGRGGGGGGRGGAATSPDGKSAAFIRDYNLWVRDVATNQETQLTTDGVKDFGYATDNAGWTSSPNAIVLWSPDSRKIATQQQDERGDGQMYVVTTPTGGVNGRLAGHPVLRAWNYPLPGDSVVTTIQRVIIDVASRKVTRLQMPPDQHRSIQGDNLSMSDVKWSPDASRIAFASVSRDHKHVWIREADAAT